MINYTDLESKVIKTVKRASAIMQGKNFTVEQKSTPSDIVTSDDVNVQMYLCDKLKKILPEAGFLCEEKNVRDFDREYVWIIDPIDGTTNYSRGLYDCAISVALVRDKQPVLAVVYNPFKKDLFTAVKGEGAKLNGKPIKVSDKPFERSLLCTAMSLYNKALAPTCFDIIAEAYNECNDVRRLGSCAVELCYLAAGKCDLYFEIRVFPWDYAGAYLVLKEAGGVLKGLHGEELAFDKPTALIGANSEDNYRRLTAIVDKHIKGAPYNEVL